MKLVSISTRYGGTSAVLCRRNIEEAIWGLDCIHSIRNERQVGGLENNVHPLDSLFLSLLVLFFLFQLVLLPETWA